MYQYVDGGRRYLPGQWPSQQTRAFDPAGAVAVYDQPPPDEQVPSYPSPAGELSRRRIRSAGRRVGPGPPSPPEGR